MSRLWMVRLGKFGEQEAHALETGELVTGWQRLEDFSAAPKKDAILHALAAINPDQKPGTINNWAVQINQLANAMQPEDLVVVPLKTTSQIAIGRIKGKYSHTAEGSPMRHVEWLQTDLPRDAIKQDLLYSLGASQTICEISRNEAVQRFETLAKTRQDPGPSRSPAIANEDVASEEAAESNVDLGINARDQIERHIAANFAGHVFTQLIAAILHAQGYQTRVSPPGADKGVDIVAGQGALGFDGPRLVVQVKSGGVTADQPTLQSLLGCISDTHAEHGLLVSWSGLVLDVMTRIREQRDPSRRFKSTGTILIRTFYWWI